MENKIIHDLLQMQDLKYRDFNLGIIGKTRYELIGIRIPLLRKYAKTLLNDDTEPEFTRTYYEEVLLEGLIIASRKCSFKEKVKMIDEFLVYIDNWGICDSFVSSLKFLKKEKDNYYPYIRKYLKSKKEYVQRYALVCLLDYYIDDDYYDDLCEILKSTIYRDYYDKMAGAWLLSYMFMKYYDRTVAFVQTNKLDEFIYKKGIQKALDSYRLNKIQKDNLRKIKTLL